MIRYKAAFQVYFYEFSFRFVSISACHKLRVLFLHMIKSCLSFYSSSLYCLNSTKSINTKVGDVIYNYLASLPPMIQHFELIKREISQLLPKKLDIEIYIFSETQYFNNVYIILRLFKARLEIGKELVNALFFNAICSDTF